MGLGAMSWLYRVGPSPTGLLGARGMGNKRPRRAPQPNPTWETHQSQGLQDILGHQHLTRVKPHPSPTGVL